MQSLAERAYELLRTVPKGRVTTYKALAEALGTHAYRAIGRAMRNNPYAPEVPCHRVVASSGQLGGFMGATQGKELTRKVALLAAEGVRVEKNRIVDFEKKLFSFVVRP